MTTRMLSRSMLAILLIALTDSTSAAELVIDRPLLTRFFDDGCASGEPGFAPCGGITSVEIEAEGRVGSQRAQVLKVRVGAPSRRNPRMAGCYHVIWAPDGGSLPGMARTEDDCNLQTWLGGCHYAKIQCIPEAYWPFAKKARAEGYVGPFPGE